MCCRHAVGSGGNTRTEPRHAGRTLYIQGERKLDFLGWVHAIQKAASSSGDTLSEQQLTDSDVPLLVDRCIDYITQCGMGQVLGCWQGPERGLQVNPLVWWGS